MWWRVDLGADLIDLAADVIRVTEHQAFPWLIANLREQGCKPSRGTEA